MAEGPEEHRDEHQQDLETREVVVHDPHLSEETNERLTAEVQAVVGAREVDVPIERDHPSRGDRPQVPPSLSLATNNWLMLVIGGFAGLVIAGIIATVATGSLWFVAVAFVLDLIGLVVVASVVLRMMGVMERPEATLVAAMQEEGIVNPEQHFTRLVDEFREADDGEGEDRETNAKDDPAAAAAEQQSAMTPTSGPSRAVGP